MISVWRKCRAFVDTLIPRYGIERGSEAALAYRYYQFLCSIIGVFFVIFSANSFRLGLHKLAVAQLLVIGIIFLSITVYRRTKSTMWAVNIIMGFTAPVTFYRVLVLGGMDSPILFGWPVISAMALMTLPFWWAMFWTAVHISFSFYFYFSESNGVVFDVIGPISVVNNVRIAMICSVQIILFFSVYLIRRLNSDLRKELHVESEEVINVVRALSHDLSSPMMTLSHWVKSLQKKGLCPDLPKDEVITVLSDCRATIDETRNREAEAAGKSGRAKSKAEDPEKVLSESMFRFTIALLLVVFTSFGAYCMAIGSYKVGMLQGAVAFAAAIGWALYKRTGSVVIAGNFIMTLGSLSGFFRAQMMGGISSPAFFVWPIIPLFVGALLPLRHAIWWVSVYIGMALYYDVAARFGIEFKSLLSPEALDQVRIIALCLVQTIVVTTIFYLKKQNAKFRSMIEEQKQTRVELLRFLSAQVGAPLRRIQDLVLAARNQEALTEVHRSLKACLDVVQLAEGWMQSLDEKTDAIVDLREIVDEVGFLQESSLKNKNIHWHVELATANEAPIVRGQKVCFAYQILNNLISNSIKFTSTGGQIKVALQNSPGHWDVVIEDTGIGIPEPLLKKIFDSDKPTTREGTDSEKGTGFGMPIVKMFVEKYDGAIDIRSNSIDTHPVGHGTRICIRLPKVALLAAENANPAVA